MIKLGITGEMGSGKTYICDIFSKYSDVCIYNTDKQASIVIDTNIELKDKLTKEFGNIYYDNNKFKTLDKIKVRKLLFSKEHEKNLEIFNSISYPYIFNHFLSFVENNNNFKIILVESALLFESKMNLLLDKIIYVSVPEEIRIMRTLKRNTYMTKEEYLNRMNSQVDPEYKKIHSDYIIENHGKWDSTIENEVDNIYNKLLIYTTTK